MKCTKESHDELRAAPAAFRSAVRNIREFPEARELLGHDLLMGECKACRSSICLEVR